MVGMFSQKEQGVRGMKEEKQKVDQERSRYKVTERATRRQVQQHAGIDIENLWRVVCRVESSPVGARSLSGHLKHVSRPCGNERVGFFGSTKSRPEMPVVFSIFFLFFQKTKKKQKKKKSVTVLMPRLKRR